MSKISEMKVWEAQILKIIEKTNEEYERLTYTLRKNMTNNNWKYNLDVLNATCRFYDWLTRDLLMSYKSKSIVNDEIIYWISDETVYMLAESDNIIRRFLWNLEDNGGLKVPDMFLNEEYLEFNFFSVLDRVIFKNQQGGMNKNE